MVGDRLERDKMRTGYFARASGDIEHFDFNGVQIDL